MKSFLYLYQKILKNRILKALKRPVTYILAVIVILYVFMIFSNLGTLVREFHLGNPQSLAVILSVLIFFVLPADFISYSKRKGLLFRQAHVHFIFPAPVNPKQVLLFAGIKNLVINVLLSVLIAFFGLLYFHVGVLQMLLYVIMYLVLENVLEGSMMILCYGNERLPEGFFKALTAVCYGLMAVFVGVAVYMMAQQGPSFGVIVDYLSHPVIQAIPVVGWNIAMIRLIFVGPTVLNVICTILFFLSTLVLFVLACRARCVGEYYEDAAKFADDYEVLRARQKKGVSGISIGKKKKFRKAEVEYKGVYAKAIFYRQLLEYKKSRFFIFGFHTVVSLIVGVGIAVLAIFTDFFDAMNTGKIFIIPGLMAYIVFIFSAYPTKWSRELENPYTFLIPDSSFKKLWYATKMEHIRAAVDAVLIALPGAFAIGLTPIQTLLNILFYVALMANKLYYYMLADVLIGSLLGNTGRSLVKLLLQCIVIGIAVVAAALAGTLFSIEAGLAALILVTLLFTFLGALGASVSFNKMEVTE